MSEGGVTCVPRHLSDLMSLGARSTQFSGLGGPMRQLGVSLAAAPEGGPPCSARADGASGLPGRVLGLGVPPLLLRVLFGKIGRVLDPAGPALHPGPSWSCGSFITRRLMGPDAPATHAPSPPPARSLRLQRPLRRVRVRPGALPPHGPRRALPPLPGPHGRPALRALPGRLLPLEPPDAVPALRLPPSR